MKHIYKGLVVCATLAFGSMSAYAQDELTSEELLADNGDKVHVAFRSTDQKAKSVRRLPRTRSAIPGFGRSDALRRSCFCSF